MSSAASAADEVTQLSAHAISHSVLEQLSTIKTSNSVTAPDVYASLRLASLAGLESFTASNVIVESADSFPNHSIDLATLLRPPHITDTSTAVNLTNAVLLHTVSASQAAVAVATLRGVVSDPVVQRGIADWDLQLYTVSRKAECLAAA